MTIVGRDAALAVPVEPASAVSPLARCDPAQDQVTIAICGEPCEHNFAGWRMFEGGHGGEQFCSKCGLGAMSYSLWEDI